jgi:hypothetical protein
MRLKKDKVMCISHNIVLQCIDTLLDYMDQRGFKYSDITAARKIHNCHEKEFKRFTKTSDHYTLFLKINKSCVKKMYSNL